MPGHAGGSPYHIGIESKIGWGCVTDRHCVSAFIQNTSYIWQFIFATKYMFQGESQIPDAEESCTTRWFLWSWSACTTLFQRLTTTFPIHQKHLKVPDFLNKRELYQSFSGNFSWILHINQSDANSIPASCPNFMSRSNLAQRARKAASANVGDLAFSVCCPL